MTAKTACVVAADALREAQPDWSTLGTPLTDGGEGFCEIMTEAASGMFKQIPVLGPRFRERVALIGLVSLERVPAPARALLDLPATGNLAIIEMAQASGLELLRRHERNAMDTSTFGTGELLAFVIEQGADAILLGIGGSATSDLGLGALEAMGLQFFDSEGRGLNQITPTTWPDIHHLDGTLEHPARVGLPPIRIACDVTNPLLGENGAARVYGPQKGIQDADQPYLETQGHRLAAMLCQYFEQPASLLETPGAGAAGGIGFGLMVAAGAKLVPGFDLVSTWLELDKHVAESDIIITGEGKFDASSLQGKGPFSIIEIARANRKNAVHLFCGRVDLSNIDELRGEFLDFSATSIGHPDWPLEKNLEQGPTRLREAILNQFS